MKFPSAKIKYHENSFGELAKCSEIPPKFQNDRHRMNNDIHRLVHPYNQKGNKKK